MKNSKFIIFSIYLIGICNILGQNEYTNNNAVTNKLLSVQTFINNGKFQIDVENGVDFNFYNLENFENTGHFQFNNNLSINSTPSGQNINSRKALKKFNNKVGGKIISEKTEMDFGYLLIDAENINNKGDIIVTNSNSIILRGNEIDLSRGTLNVRSGRDFEAGLNELGEPSYIAGMGNYQDKRIGNTAATDWGVNDVYWGVGQSQRNGQGGVYAEGSDTAVAVSSSSYRVTELVSPKNLIYDNYNLFEKPMQIRYPIDSYGSYINWGIAGASGFSRRVDRQGSDFQPYVNFNQVLEGDGDNTTQRWYGQGVFIYNRNESVNVTPKLDSGDGLYGLPYGPLDNFVLEIKTSVTNKIEETSETYSLYLISEFGNLFRQATLLTNSQPTVAKQTFLPSSLSITRNQNKEFQEGIRFNGSITDGPFFGLFGRGATENAVINWSSYGMRFTNVMSRINYSTENIIQNDNIIDVTFENEDIQAGSVVINADTLNLEAAKIRAEGNLKIKANNLISSKNAILDCQNISLDIGSRSEILIIEDLIADEVYRFGGSLEIFEAAWDDSYKIFDTNDAGEIEETTIPLHYKSLFLDIESNTTNKVLVQSLKLRGKDIVIEDKVNLIGDLLLESESVTFNNEFIINKARGKTFKWDDSIAKGLISLTNNVLLSIPGDVQMGSKINPYLSFVNNGTNIAENFELVTRNFENAGLLKTHGSLSIDADYINLHDSTLDISENTIINSKFFKIRNTTNIFNGILSFNVDNILVDGGDNSTNALYIHKGINSFSDSTSGKLLNTELYLSVDSYKSFAVKWNSSKDIGPVNKGFVDNRAIGQLSLTNSYLGEFNFSTDSKNGAIYVDRLHIDGFNENKLKTNKLEQIRIRDGMKIYFASSNLPEEIIDGLHDGKLVWVKEYAGRYSSMPLYLEGLDKAVKVNRAYRRSEIFDTDNDGIANGFDLSPFGDGRPILKLTNGVVSWLGVPQANYSVEYTYALNEEWVRLQVLQGGDTFKDLKYKIPKNLRKSDNRNSSFFVRVKVIN